MDDKTNTIDSSKKRIKILRDLCDNLRSNPRLRVSVYIAEMDRRRNMTRNPKIQLLLTDEELDSLQEQLLNNKYQPTLQKQWDRYLKIQKAIVEIMRAYERLNGVTETMMYNQSRWAMAEQMEQAVNIALLQIPDKETRKATAVGIAKHIELLAYSQSVDPDGLLVISTHNSSFKYDAASRLQRAAAAVTKTIGDFKAAVEATEYAMKKWGLWTDMAATRGYIKQFVKEAEFHNTIWSKYYDAPMMDADTMTASPDALKSGQPLLYEPYRLMKKYSDIPANEKVKSIFLKYYIGYTEPEKNKEKDK